MKNGIMAGRILVGKLLLTGSEKRRKGRQPRQRAFGVFDGKEQFVQLIVYLHRV